jgi:hypothetical protein
MLADCFAWDNWTIQIFLLGVFWEVKCFNQKWLHHHQLKSYSKDSAQLASQQSAPKNGVL